MNPWQKAVDQQRIIAHIGVAADGVTDEEAAQQLAELIDWHVRVATDPAVNGGFVLVPVEPTEEMKRRGTFHVSNPCGLATDVWSAMLAARPEVL